MTDVIYATLMFSIGFGIGVLYGWMNKDNYPGSNDTDTWSKGHRIGYHTGYKQGLKDGRKEIMKKIEKMKVDAE